MSTSEQTVQEIAVGLYRFLFNFTITLCPLLILPRSITSVQNLEECTACRLVTLLALQKNYSQICLQKKAGQKNVTNKQSNLLTHNTHKEQVFSACVTAAATLTCWLVISVITLCNHSFSTGRERKKKVLVETSQKQLMQSGSGQSISFFGGGITVSLFKSSGICMQPSGIEAQQHMENGNIRQEVVRLSFSEFMFKRSKIK